jgi:hypothetical protein
MPADWIFITKVIEYHADLQDAMRTDPRFDDLVARLADGVSVFDVSTWLADDSVCSTFIRTFITPS